MVNVKVSKKRLLFICAVVFCLCTMCVCAVSAEEIVKEPVLKEPVTKLQIEDNIRLAVGFDAKIDIVVKSEVFTPIEQLQKQTEILGYTQSLDKWMAYKMKVTEDYSPVKPVDLLDDSDGESQWNTYLINYYAHYKPTGDFGGKIV